jgi:hypothetical protein
LVALEALELLVVVPEGARWLSDQNMVGAMAEVLREGPRSMAAVEPVELVAVAVEGAP